MPEAAFRRVALIGKHTAEIAGSLRELRALLRARGCEVRVERETAGGREMTLTLALSYSGRSEIVDAVRRMAEDARSGALDPSAIDEDVLSRYLDTRDFEDPDLVIRTGGEQRLSNFLIWQSAYAEFYTSPLLWPDFGPEAFDEALLEFARRTRRFGR